jgi:hypothetical protein
MEELGAVGGTVIEIEGIARVEAPEMEKAWRAGLTGALGFGG